METVFYVIAYLLFSVLSLLIFPGIPVAIILFVLKRKRKKEEEERRYAQIEYERKKEEERKEIELLVKKYKNNPRTKKAAEEFADICISYLKKLDRGIRYKDISLTFSLGFNLFDDNHVVKVGGSVWYRFSCDMYSNILVDFDKEYLTPIKEKNDMIAFVRSIYILAYDIIVKNYEKDESGSTYEIEVIEDYSSTNKFGYGSGNYAIKSKYKAENYFYQPPQEW